MEYKDYYKILGVSEKADTDEIKSAYRKLARKFHPDVSKEEDAESKFKDVSEAYEVLKDAEKRAEYDQLRQMGARGRDGQFHPPPGWESASHFRHGGFTTGDASNFSDFFEEIFGGGHGHFRQAGGGFNMRMRGEDIHTRLPIFLEEAYSGCQKQIRFRVPEMDNQGRMVQRDKTLNIKIPKGMTHGQQIRLAGQGGPGYGGGENGDLFIEIQVAPHPLFTLQGEDIYLTVPVAPWEAALGATVTIPVVGGKTRLKIPKGVSSGRKLRLKGKGMASERKQGDLIAVLKIVMPGQHSEEAKALYEQLAKAEQSFNPRADL